jgi:hypothetical protein
MPKWYGLQGLIIIIMTIDCAVNMLRAAEQRCELADADTFRLQLKVPYCALRATTRGFGSHIQTVKLPLEGHSVVLQRT